MVPTLDLMNQNLEKACCREASHLYLNISRGFLGPLKSENICLNWTVLTGMIAVLIISVFDLFFNLRKWLLARSQGDHWYYPWNQPLKDVAGEGRVEGRLGGAKRTEPMQPALSTQASQILVVTPSNSAFITLHMFIQHQLYARHYTRAVKRTCMAKGLTSFRVCVCVCVCVFVHACVHTGSIFKALSLGFSMEYLTSWMPILCAAWVRVFLGCFPFLHGPFSFCILVSA